jgi:predicted amidophosphoribosyltransferase
VPSAACVRCRRQNSAIDHGRSAGPYEGALRAIIHAFKYDTRRSLAPKLAALMQSQAGDLLNGIDTIIPVPLHRTRQRTRGFNQAEDLARALKQSAPVLRALRRIRRTQPQTDLPAAQRHRNVRDAFALAVRPANTPHPDPLPARGAREKNLSPLSRLRERVRVRGSRSALVGKCVLLVDDVCTTGATLEACARVLKAAGVREVRAVTVARAVLPRRR